MNQKIKKIIAGLCAIAMICGTVATLPTNVISNTGIGIVASANVIQNLDCGEDLTATFDTDTGVLTVKGNGTSMVASQYKLYSESIKSVKFETSNLESIGEDAFAGFSSLESIIIPTSVKTIARQAFVSCTKLESITIPSNVETIGEYAFNKCENLTTVNMSGATNLKTIGEFAFVDCTKLESITIPAKVETISQYAFYGCNNLKTVNMSGATNLKTIGGFAFKGCTKLESITIPSSVETIGEYAFNECENLKTVNMSGATNLKTIGQLAFSECNNLETVDMSGATSLDTIENSAFSGCENLTTVNLSKATSLKTIGTAAFYNTKLTSIIIPESVETIEAGAFCALYSDIEFVTILNPEVEIKNGSFASNNSLVKVYTKSDATPAQCTNLEDKIREYSALNVEVIPHIGHDYKLGVCTICGEVDPDYAPDEPVAVVYDISASNVPTVTLSTNNACCGERVYVKGVSGEKYTVRTTAGKVVAVISGSGSFVMPDAEIVITGGADASILMNNTFSKSYIYVCDGDMNVTKTFTTKNGSEIKIDCGKENAGKTVTVYEGKKSTKTEYTTVTLDGNGKATVTVETGKNYTAVID